MCLCQYHIVLVTINLYYSLKSGIPYALFFFMIVFGCLGFFFVVPNELKKNFFSCFGEICHWNLDKDCFESIDGFGYYEHFNNANSSDP